MNSEIKRKEEEHQLTLKINRVETTNSQEIAENLNKCFTKIAEQTLVTINQNQKGSHLTFSTANCTLNQISYITLEEVQDLITFTKPKISTRNDEVSSKLKKSALIPYVEHVICCHVQNMSFMSAIGSHVLVACLEPSGQRQLCCLPNLQFDGAIDTVNCKSNSSIYKIAFGGSPVSAALPVGQTSIL